MRKPLHYYKDPSDRLWLLAAHGQSGVVLERNGSWGGVKRKSVSFPDFDKNYIHVCCDVSQAIRK